MRLLLTSFLLSVSLTAAMAQSAEESFHGGAHLFVGGKLAEAKAVVESGLAESPGHAKLEALRQLIEEEEEQQSGATGSQNQQDQEQEDSESQPAQQDPSQGDQDEQSQSESQQEQEQPSEDGQPPESESGEQEEPTESQQRQSNAAGQENSDELSRAQALRILQALQHEEEQLLREVQKVKGKARRVEKDW